MWGAWLLAGALLVTGGWCQGGGSLRGALEALQRRQRARAALTDAREPRYRAYQDPLYTYQEEPHELSNDEFPENLQQKYIIKYLNEEPVRNNYMRNKKKTESTGKEHKQSAFRERAHKHEQDDKLEKLFAERDEEEVGNKQKQVQRDDVADAMLLHELLVQYLKILFPNLEAHASPQNSIKMYKERKIQKRQYSDDDGWGPVAFKRKRSTSENENPAGDDDYPTLDYPLQQNDRYKYKVEQQPSVEPDSDERDDYIAFVPLDADKLDLPTYGDDYAYDTRDKRFPVSKRSSVSYHNAQKKRSVNKQTQKSFLSGSGTDPKVIRDLSKIFGDSGSISIKTPVKRSYKNEDSHESKPPQVTGVPHDHPHEHNETHIHEDASHELHQHGMHPPTIAGKEEEVTLDKETHQHSISLKKKSIDWSQYFGLDKRSKKPILTGNENRFVKQYKDTFIRELDLQPHKQVKRGFADEHPIDESELEINRASIAIRSEKKRNAGHRAEENMDNITPKLTESNLDSNMHESELESKEEQQMKEDVLSRLAAAYSLEKMRKAIKDFKKTIPQQTNQDVEKSKEKRIAVKKEKAELKHEDAFSVPTSGMGDNGLSEQFESEQGAGQYLDGAIDEPLSEGYMGGSGTHTVPLQYSGGSEGDCPALNHILRRCRGLDLLAGDRGQLFLPLCSLHQICYLCGESAPTACDLAFVSEADTACGGDARCSRAARAALMAMRELHEGLADAADGDCEPCLSSALWNRAAP